MQCHAMQSIGLYPHARPTHDNKHTEFPSGVLAGGQGDRQRELRFHSYLPHPSLEGSVPRCKIIPYLLAPVLLLGIGLGHSASRYSLWGASTRLPRCSFPPSRIHYTQHASNM